MTKAITQDWSARRPAVSRLEKRFLRMTEETVEDGCLINDSIRIEPSGPIIENDLGSVPSRFDKKMDIQQLLQSRMFKCEYWVMKL